MCKHGVLVWERTEGVGQPQYLVMIDVGIPSDDDPLLDPGLRDASLHRLTKEKDVNKV